jgi:hypothetical protein
MSSEVATGNDDSIIEEIYTVKTLTRGKKSATIRVSPNDIIVPMIHHEFVRSLMEEIGLKDIFSKGNREREGHNYSYSLDNISQDDYNKLMLSDFLVPEKFPKRYVDVFKEQPASYDKPSTRDLPGESPPSIRKRKYAPSNAGKVLKTVKFKA